MKKIICALLILCSSLFSEELISLHVNGPKEGRVNIVFLAEGYTRYQQDRFIEDMNTFFEAIIQFEPLSHYERYINVYGIWAESPSQGIGGYYGSYQWPDIERLLVADNELVYNSISELIPEADIPVVIINSEIYGGSGGEIAVATSGAPEIVAHEIGHSFASLGDEYEYETPGQNQWKCPMLPM